MTTGFSYANETSSSSSYHCYVIVVLSSRLNDFLLDGCINLNVFLLNFKQYLVDTVEHLILAIICYVALCVVLYVCIVQLHLLGFTRDMTHANRVLFVTAHPDDEVMFFGPTILNYTKKPNCLVYLMCLSSGKNYGMHKIRTTELYKSCKLLGIKEENVIVHNSTHLPDAMDVRWPLEIIAKHVVYAVEAFSITNIVTFDRNGISSHANHCSIYYAIANLILDKALPKTCGVYVLESVNILRKYWLFLDIPISYIMSRFRNMEGFIERRKIHKAMCQHESQLVWFRKWYMIFSRYMLINTLEKMNLVDIEMDYLEMDNNN